jgi:hypothetical protein
MDDASKKRVKGKDSPRRGAMKTTDQPRVRIKRLTLDLSEPLHRAIKRNAAEEGVTMAGNCVHSWRSITALSRSDF